MIPELAKHPEIEKTLLSVYNKCPSFIHDVIVSGYGYHYRKQSLNKQVFEYLSELEKTQYYSKEELEAYQNEKLRTLIAHAYENVPYYRRLFDNNNINPADIKTRDDLTKIPYLTKDDIRNNFHDLIAKDHSVEKMQLVHTSGTTGSPLEFYWDKNVMLMENAFIRRHWKWAGFGIDDWRITLRGNIVVPLSKRKKPFWKYNYPEKQVFFSSFHMNNETLPDYIKEIKKISPKAIQAYPSAISTLAKYMRENGIIIPVGAVFTSSEPIHPLERELIEKQFQCRIYDLYGLSERTVASGQCSEGNYHIYSEYGIVELVKDGQVIQDEDTPGEIVSTGLNNFGMPLIRYKTGDVTKLKNTGCKCGRHLPVMEPVSSRLDDMIITPDGRILPPAVVETPIKNLMSIEKSQIIQEKRDQITLRIVKRPDYSESDSTFLSNELKNIVGEGVNIGFEFVDDIPLSKSGKFKRVISSIKTNF